MAQSVVEGTSNENDGENEFKTWLNCQGVNSKMIKKLIDGMITSMYGWIFDLFIFILYDDILIYKVMI